METANHETRRTRVAPPRLGARDRGRLADAHDLIGDLAPSLGRYSPPTRVLEHGEELAVRVAETGSDLDLHAPRIRPAVGDPAGVGGAVDAPSGMRNSRDVRTYT